MTIPGQARLTIELQASGGAGDSWIMLFPAGVVATNDGRGPYRVTNAASVIANSMAAGKIAFDENHSTDLAAPEGRPSPALGWITEMQNRDSGIWGRVDWNESGRKLIVDRAYRGVSPVLRHDGSGNVQEILRASLTNNPNLRGMVTLHSQGANMDELLKQLRTALGLADDADAAAIVAKVKEITTAPQSVDPAKYVPIEMLERATAEARRLDQGISLQASTTHVEHLVETRKILPWMKEWAIELCGINKPALDKFVAKTAPSLQVLFMPLVPSRPPSDREINSSRHGLSDDELAIASRMGVKPEDFAKNRNANTGAA
jgi:phage I-like protein